MVVVYNDMHPSQKRESLPFIDSSMYLSMSIKELKSILCLCSFAVLLQHYNQIRSMTEDGTHPTVPSSSSISFQSLIVSSAIFTLRPS